MATYYTINGEKEREKTEEGEEKTKGTSDTSGPAEAGNATKRENAGRAGETAARSFAERASAREARFVGAHKKVSLAKVDPSLAAAPDPAANAGIHPGLVPVLRRGLLGLGRGLLEDVRQVRPKGKTLTLEEYKVRQGVE